MRWSGLFEENVVFPTPLTFVVEDLHLSFAVYCSNPLKGAVFTVPTREITFITDYYNESCTLFDVVLQFMCNN